MSEVARWLKPDARCPNCGSPPAYRINARHRTFAFTVPPDEPIQSVQCSVGWCRTIYLVPARAHQGAA